MVRTDRLRDACGCSRVAWLPEARGCYPKANKGVNQACGRKSGHIAAASGATEFRRQRLRDWR